MELSKEQEEFALFLQQNTEEIRGQIISYSIAVEQIIDNFISYYFVSSVEKRGRFIELFLQKNSIGRKFGVFKIILKTYEPLLYNTQKEDIDQIGNLISLRNELAHSKIDTTLENLAANHQDKTSLYLLELKNGKSLPIIKPIAELKQTIVDTFDLIGRIKQWTNNYIVRDITQ